MTEKTPPAVVKEKFKQKVSKNTIHILKVKVYNLLYKNITIYIRKEEKNRMDKTTAIRLSEKEYKELEELKKAYNISNTSEVLRMLIRNDYTKMSSYEGLKELSDKKQKIKVGLFNNSITKIVKEG